MDLFFRLFDLSLLNCVNTRSTLTNSVALSREYKNNGCVKHLQNLTQSSFEWNCSLGDYMYEYDRYCLRLNGSVPFFITSPLSEFQ